MHTNLGVTKSRLQHKVCVEIGKTDERRMMRVREGMRSNPDYYFLNF